MTTLTDWRPTGFGGSACRGVFNRAIGEVTATRNGTQIDLWFSLPGSDEPVWLQFRADDLRAATQKKHGEQTRLLAETDVLVYSDAYRQLMERITS